MVVTAGRFENMTAPLNKCLDKLVNKSFGQLKQYYKTEF